MRAFALQKTRPADEPSQWSAIASIWKRLLYSKSLPTVSPLIFSIMFRYELKIFSDDNNLADIVFYFLIINSKPKKPVTFLYSCYACHLLSKNTFSNPCSCLACKRVDHITALVSNLGNFIVLDDRALRALKLR